MAGAAKASPTVGSNAGQRAAGQGAGAGKRTRFGWVTFLSDYGLDDVFVGVCKGVMAQVAPHLRIIDVSHLVSPQAVDQGATSLAAAIPYLPQAVHLALVDPIRQAPARGVVVETATGSLLVGPDNGLLSLGWEALGGARRAFLIDNRALWREAVHVTFRGRDVFAPVTAHLANGVPLEEVGPELAVADLTKVRSRDAVVDDDHVHAEVRSVDHFGNLQLNCARSDLEAAGIALGDTVEVRVGGRTHHVGFTLSYGDVAAGRVALCEDSFRSIQLAVNLGDASRVLRASRGAPVVIARVPQAAVRSSQIGI